MGNGTKRFVQIEKYICSLPENKQSFAVRYYSSMLNHPGKAIHHNLSHDVSFRISSKIQEIMYKI